jgi:hypothetical protein
MKKIALVLVALIILFSGCVKLHVNQKIHSNLDSDYEVKMDLSGFANAAKSMGSMYSDSSSNFIEEFDKNFAGMCNDIQENNEFIKELSDFKCSVDVEKHTLTFSGTRSLKDDSSLTVERGLFNKYIYDVSKGKEFLSSMNSGNNQNLLNSTQLSAEELEAQKAYLKSMGFEMVYTLEMPGTITKTEIGEIKDNKVVIDLLDLTGKENFYVESEELNAFYVVSIAAAITLILALLVILLVKFKKKKGS